MGNDVFVKLNVKNIGEIRSLIVDKQVSGLRYDDRYLMCAGKYDKSGWTIVFKAKDYKEAEYIIEHTSMHLNKVATMVNNNANTCDELDISITKKFKNRNNNIIQSVYAS